MTRQATVVQSWSLNKWGRMALSWHFLMSQWQWLNHTCVILLSQSSLFTRNPRIWYWTCQLMNVEWEVTSHPFQARLQEEDWNWSQDGELGTGLSTASHTHLAFTAHVSMFPQQYLPMLVATFNLEHHGFLPSGVSLMAIPATYPPPPNVLHTPSSKWPRTEFFFF